VLDAWLGTDQLLDEYNKVFKKNPYLLMLTLEQQFIMKNYFLVFALFSFIGLSNAQFGVSVSYGSSKPVIKAEGLSITSDGGSNSVGIGLFVDVELSEKLDLQPSISYGIGEQVEGESNNALGLGANLDYYLGGRENSFFLRGGLGMGVALADVDTELAKKSATSAVLGLGYDISDKFSLIASYGTQLTDSSNIEGLEIRANALSIQLQLKL
tara:strand:- start:1973 stop:2608 length:636 start_codon:yes stop_codon:yes gene_type:complete